MIKKIVVIIAISISIVSCDKKVAEFKEAKTAYVDTSELMKEYTATKDLDAKYKAKGEEKGRQLEAEINRFKQEAQNFQAQAQANGQAWAQQKGAELQRREQQLAQAQQALAQQLQQEGGTEMDSLVSNVKKTIKAYGKENFVCRRQIGHYKRNDQIVKRQIQSFCYKRRSKKIILAV